EDLGVRHRLWVYSGRRGVHCWVCDDAVRKWSPALRAAAVEYLTLVKVGHPGLPGELGEGAGPRPRRYPCQSGPRAGGERGSVPGGAGLVASTVSIISLDRRAQHREALQGEFPKKRDSVQRWELLKGRMERTRVMTLLSLFFAGRISVPLDLQRLEQFDPFAVPTISSLCEELDAEDTEQEEGSETEPKRRVRGEWGQGLGCRVGGSPLPAQLLESPDYRKTSLAPYVRIFEQFVEEMERERRGELLRRSGGC
ncbi:PRI1 primase, partial [Piaya cayana]|nr:PRI1 primase [Piaya cayana]